MSVSAAELPMMSGSVGGEQEVAQALRQRLDAGLRRIAYFIVPSVVAFLVLGDVIVAAVYQSGRFTHDDVIYVWGILAGATVGLLASTLGRLYSSTYYALRDTRTPLRYSIVRISLTTVLGYLCAIPLPPAIGIGARWGVAGLTISAGISGWIEFLLLRRTMNRRIGSTGLPLGFSAKIWSAAIAASAAGWLLHYTLGPRQPVLLAGLVLIPYGLLYFLATTLLGIPEARALTRLLPSFGRKFRH
jgi:putative peptidoglycan lipid II flippase